MNTPEIRLLNTPKLAELCAEHTERYKNQIASISEFCFELLRRAAFADAEAWEKVYAQYGPSIRAKITAVLWLEGTEIEDLVQETWERFCQYVLNPVSWHKFPHLPGILVYLDHCAQTSIIIYQRKIYRQEQIEQPLENADFANYVPAENPIEYRLEIEEWRKAVWNCLASHCRQPEELFLAEQCFVFDRKPQEIATLYSELFASAEIVSQKKRNLLDRLKRDGRCLFLLANQPKS